MVWDQGQGEKRAGAGMGYQGGLEVERLTGNRKVAGLIPGTERRLHSSRELVTRRWLVLHLLYGARHLCLSAFEQRTEPDNSSRDTCTASDPAL